MSNYDNYIYLTICETSIQSYKQTNYSSYTEYCKGMNQYLKDGDISKRDRRAIENIVVMLDRIFSLNPELTGQYIGDYFGLDSSRHQAFERTILETKLLFPITGD